tara:strand:+ start:838 stop:1317 length:480 start_codon:yes stop_codon:yes gene_type:complete
MLDTGGVFIVSAIHHWANATKNNIDPFPCLIEGFRAANILDRVNTGPIILDDVLSSLIVSLNENPKELFGSCSSLGQIEEVILIIIALSHSGESALAKRLIETWVPRSTARFIYPNLVDLANSLISVELKISLPPQCMNTISYILNSGVVLYSNKYIVN